jgi:hypothetical protein
MRRTSDPRLTAEGRSEEPAALPFRSNSFLA